MDIRYLLFITLITISSFVSAQNKDSIKPKELDLSEIIIAEYRTVNGVGHLPDEKEEHPD